MLTISTLKEAAAYLDKPAFYRVVENRNNRRKTIYFPVMIVDARMLFGRLELGYVPIGGRVEGEEQHGWATQAAITLEKGEQ